MGQRFDVTGGRGNILGSERGLTFNVTGTAQKFLGFFGHLNTTLATFFSHNK
jgi:hypothetical protein